MKVSSKSGSHGSSRLVCYRGGCISICRHSCSQTEEAKCTGSKLWVDTEISAQTQLQTHTQPQPQLQIQEDTDGRSNRHTALLHCLQSKPSPDSTRMLTALQQQKCSRARGASTGHYTHLSRGMSKLTSAVSEVEHGTTCTRGRDEVGNGTWNEPTQSHHHTEGKHHKRSMRVKIKCRDTSLVPSESTAVTVGCSHSTAESCTSPTPSVLVCEQSFRAHLCSNLGMNTARHY